MRLFNDAGRLRGVRSRHGRNRCRLLAACARTALWRVLIVGSCWLGVAHLCALPILDGAHLLAPEVLVLQVHSVGLASAGLPIRRLSAADLAACVELAADRGWPPERNKLRLLFAVGEAYGIDDPAGGLAAMVVLTRYGRQLAAVGTMVVASRFGRRGLGQRLTTYLLEQAGPALVYLGPASLCLDVRPRADGRAGPEGIRRGSQARADLAVWLRRAGLSCRGRPGSAGRFRGSMAQRG